MENSTSFDLPYELESRNAVAATESAEISPTLTVASSGAPQSANLDLLRSFAVLSVLVAHFTGGALHTPAFLYLGQTGVLLFFVHTSLVLLRSLHRLHADGHGRVAARFLTQRAFRLYPLYIAAIAFALVLQVPIEGPFDPDITHGPWRGWKAIVSNVLMLQNLTLDLPVSEPMWTLPYEMQMYLALPAIYLLTCLKEPMARLFLVSVSAIVVTLLMLAFLPNTFNYLDLPFAWFVPCFMGGAYAFCRFRASRPRLPVIGLPVLLAGCVALYSVRPGAYLQWILCAVIGFALPLFREIRNARIRATCQSLATYSYGIYLWHWPLLWLCFRKFEKLTQTTRFALFFCSLAILSVGSYHLIELPLIRMGRRLASSNPAYIRSRR